MNDFGIGARLPRLEDARFLEGRGQFCADIALPGTLHAAFVRSPHAHARIVAVRKPQGFSQRVYHAEDLIGVGKMRSTAKLPGFKPSDWPILAAGKVRHVGEPIAMAIGSTPAEAEDLAALVEVDFDPLPPVVTMADALKNAAPFVHDEWGDNILVDIKLEGGDLAAAKSAAAHVVERSFRMNRMHPLPLEGRACIASYDSRLDELIIYVAHQLPVPLQIGLSEVLGVSSASAASDSPGCGCVVWPEDLCRKRNHMRCLGRNAASAARAMDSGSLQIACLRRQLPRLPVQGHRLCRCNGRVLGLECDVIVDSGAYSPWPWPAGIEGGLAIGNMQGCYDIRAFRGRAINVVSNKPAGQPFRGVARPLSCCGHEIIMDGIAQAVGIDPVEVRLRNFVQPAQMPYVSITKKTLDSGNYAAALKRAAELIDLPAVRARQKKKEPDGRLIGVGFASFYEQTAYGTGPFGYSAWGIELVPGMEPVVARLTGDGELVLEVGSHSHGQGHETVFAQVAHEVLGIDPHAVSVRYGDTSTSPAGTGTYTSRSMVTTGGAVAEACRFLMAPIAKIGAHLLQCKDGDVQIKNGRVYGPQGSVEFREIGRAWYHHPEDLPADMDPVGLTATAGHKAHDPGVFSYSTHAAVVVVDPDIGSVEVLDYAIVADCGTRVNPLLVEGQVLGGFSNGLGNALYEESSYDELGQPTATTLADYAAPTAPLMPDVKLDFLETPSPFSKFGIKGIGENGAIGPPASIVNAVNDALRPLGASVFETPVSARRVREAIGRARSNGAL